MIRFQRFVPFLLLAVLALTLACGTDPSPEGSPEGGSSPADSGSEGGQLPAGHPPIGNAEPMEIPQPDPGSGTGASGLIWEAPGSWESETPANPMRRAQYRIPGEGGDGECIVYYFGPGQGGDAMSNAQRWAMQLTQPDGSSPLDAMQTENTEANGIPVMLVEITGTYEVGQQMGGTGQAVAGYMMLGAIAEGPDANWFFKLTGPEALVRAEKAAFRSMVESIRQGS